MEKNKKSSKKFNFGAVKTNIIVALIVLIIAFIGGTIYQKGVDQDHIQVNINNQGTQSVLPAKK